MQMIVEFFVNLFSYLGELFAELIEWIQSLIAQM